MSDNPFFHRGVIRDPAHFSNRKKEVKRAFEMLEKGQSISVVGPRKIGKTSFLFYLRQPQVMQQYWLDLARYLFVYIDCQSVGNLNREVVYVLILDEVKNQAAQQGRDVEDFDRPASYSDFERSLGRLLGNSLKLILLFDEFEGLALNHNLGKEFFNGLRALSTRFEIAYVTVSQRPLSDLLDKRDSSNFFNIFSLLSLGLFDAADSTDLIEDYMGKIGSTLGQEATSMVLDLGGGHPFFLQIAGYWAFDLQNTRVASLHFKDRNILEQAVHSDVESHFEYYWQHLQLCEQYVLAALPLTQDKDIYREELESLRSLCLVVEQSGRYEYFSHLFRTWVRRQKMPDVLQAGPVVILLSEQEVLVHELRVTLGTKTYALLAYLVQHEGRVASIEELDREILAPPEERADYHFVSDDRLKSAIRELRRALGDEDKCIVNKRGVGYMFQAPNERESA